MAGSEPGASAAMSGRGDRFTGAPEGYRILLPYIQSEDSMKPCLVLHCDLAGRPYRIDDFRAPFLQLGVLQDIAGIGPFQMGHVWLIKLRTPEARQKLVDAGGISVKGRYCAVIDPIKQEVTVKLHWVPFHIPDSAIRKVFADFGDVSDVRQDAWGASGFEASESTTRIVRLTLRDGLTPDDLPHMFKFYGGSVLVVVPGRAPQCLRCHRNGHIRKDCRTPRCVKCKSFGHLAQECVRTYANVTGSAEQQEVHPLVMDDEEAEAAAATSAGATAVPVGEGDKVTEAENASDKGEGNAKEGTRVVLEGAVNAPTATEQNEDAEKEGDGDTSSQRSVSSTLTQKSDGYQTADETPGATMMDNETASAKRRREPAPSDEQRLARLEREWIKTAGKKGKYVAHQPRSQSQSRTVRS